MSKIFNWFFGSFFRTLGRIVVFILLGYLFFSFINISDIKIPNLFGVLNVSADTGSAELNYRFSTPQQEIFVNKTGVFSNWGMSYIYFSVASYTDGGGNYPIKSVVIDNGGSGESVCTSSNYYTYTDNTTQYNVVNYVCHTNLGANGLGKITFQFPSVVNPQSTHYETSYLVYVVQDSDNTTDLVNAIQNSNATSSINALNNALQVKLTEQIQNDNTNTADIIQSQTETKNAIDNLKQQVDTTNSKLDDINSSITDSSSPNLEGLNNSAGWLPQGPIDGILNLPLTFLNSLTTNLSKTCNPVELPLPFLNKTLTLPCVNSLYSQIDGLQVWINSISVIASAFILFRYLLNLYIWVDDTLTFRENNFLDNWSGV